MVTAFHKILDSHLYSCFKWKRVRRKSTDKPWISDGIRARMKKRKAIFWNEGQSETWKRVDKAIKQTIAFRKRLYEEKMTKKLEESGRSGQWYSIYKFLNSDDMLNRWNITELKPNQHPKELANELAEHFVKITNMANKLEQSQIPQSNTGNGLIPQLDRKGVKDHIRKFKKCNSSVNAVSYTHLTLPTTPYV